MASQMNSTEASSTARKPKTKSGWGWYEWLFVRYYLESVPGINFCYDIYFDDNPPKWDQTKDLLSMISVVDTLLLGFSFSIVGSVNYDELIEADTRWSTAAAGTPNATFYNNFENSFIQNGLNSWKGLIVYQMPSVAFNGTCTAATCFLFTSLMAVVIMMMDGLGKDLEPYEDEEGNKQVLHSWWRYAKYVVMIAHGFMILGILYSLFAYTALLQIKIPVYASGCNTYSDFSSVFACTKAYSDTFMRIIFFLVISLIVGILGLGTADRYRTARIINDHRYIMKNRHKVDDFVVPVRACGLLIPQYNPALYGDNYVKSPLSRLPFPGRPSIEDEYDPKKYREKNMEYPPPSPSSSSDQPPQPQESPSIATATAVGTRSSQQLVPPTTSSFFGGSYNDKRYGGDVIPPMSTSGVYPAERIAQNRPREYPY